MATIEQRYTAAVDYVRRALKVLEPSWWNVFEHQAYDEKTKTVRSDLERIDGRWLRATSDKEREAIARDAELLADRTKENLPGATSDWKRTNLYAGEVEHQTPATSFWGELSGELHQHAEHVPWKPILYGAGAVVGVLVLSRLFTNNR
jgi:hypothetical protein